MNNPTAHVVEKDLRALFRQLVDVVDVTPEALKGGLVKLAKTEWAAWRRVDVKRGLPKKERLTPTDWAVLAVIAPWRRLRGGEDGCGVQTSARALARELGVHRRYISKSFARLCKLGLLRRRPRQVEIRWEGTKKGKPHVFENADIQSVCYLTKAGLARLEVVQGRPCRLVVALGGGMGRVLSASGIVGKLFRAAKGKIPLVARRVSALEKKDRPTALKRPTETTQTGSPQGNAVFSVRGSNWRPRTPRQREKNSGGAGVGGDDARLRELWRTGRLTPDVAWPDWWESIRVDGKPVKLRAYYAPNGEPKVGGYCEQHWWGFRECARLLKRFQAEANRLLRHRPTT